MVTKSRLVGDGHEQAFAVRLRPWTLWLARAGIVTIHALCVVYYSLAGLVFRRAATTYSMMILSQYNVTLPKQYFPGIAVVHFVLAACHGYFLVYKLLRFIWRSIKSRISRVVPFPSPTSSGRFSSSFRKLSSHRKYIKLYEWNCLIDEHLLSRRGIFGVEHPHFDHIFLLRETVELVLQTYQGYTMSLVLPRNVLKGVFVSVLALNCWLSSILHYSVESEATRRLLCRLGDTVQDFVSSIGVPVIIALDYVHEIIPQILDLNPERWNDNDKVITTLSDIPYLLMGSWLDAISRFVFAIGLISSLRSVRSLLAPQKCSVAPIGKRQPISKQRSTPRMMSSSTHSSRGVVLCHKFVSVVGVVILVAHMHSEMRPPPPPYCGLGVWSWFARTPTCATIEFNCCLNRELSGRTSELDAFLDEVRANGVRGFAIRHCSHVEFSSRLHNLRNVLQLSIYNSSVVRWEDDAALSDDTHPQLRFATFIRTQFLNGTLPRGFFAPRFPRLAGILTFLATNLATIPFDVHDRCPRNLSLELELSELSEIPFTFILAEPKTLSLSYNRISSMPPQLLTSSSLFSLGLTGNPIQQLPDQVERAAITLHVLSVDSTNLTSLPSWASADDSPSPILLIIAAATPFCEQSMAGAISMPVSPSVIVSCFAEDFTQAATLDTEIRANEVW